MDEQSPWHLRPVDGDGTGEPPVTDAEKRGLVPVIDRLMGHFYILLALAALVGLFALLLGTWPALVATVILGFLAGATASGS